MNVTKLRLPRWSTLLASLAVMGLGFLVLLSGGCGSGSNNGSPGERTKLKVAYLGLTCEAPIFVAKEKGFYEEEGLDVELEKTNWDGLREGLGTGRFDANHTLVMYLLQAIEKKADLKITGGIHTGCLRLQVSTTSNIKSLDELRGKKIGVPTHLFSPPHMFASRVLASRGFQEPQKDVEWLAFDPGDLEKALKDRKIDGVATSDPIGTILLGKEIVKTLADQAVDHPYCDEYCCATVVSGKLARDNPLAAAKVTRAMLKAAKWVNENPTAAAKLGVDNKFVSASAEVNAQALSKLKYIPGVAECRKSVLHAAEEMKKAGLLADDANPEEIARRAWLDLDGVSDEWLKAVTVEKVADGGRPQLLNPVEFVALFEAKKDCVCCCRCCIDR